MIDSEKKLEAYFAKRVYDEGGIALKLKFLAVRGAPDRLVLLPPNRIAFVELKSPRGTGRVSTAQSRIIKLLTHYGQDVAVLSTTQEVEQWISTRAHIKS